MRQERLEFLMQHIDKMDIDIEKGTVSYAGGYQTLAIEGKHFGIHEIIAVAAGLDVIGMSIDHVDCDKRNNSIHNLEAVSQGENLKRAHENGLIDYSKRAEKIKGNQFAKQKFTEEERMQMIREREAGVPVKEIAAKWGINVGYFYRMMKKRSVQM